MDPIVRADKIRSALFIRGLTFTDIDRHYNLPRGTAYTTLREPNPRGEAALAEALALDPRKLWSERYDASGQRLGRQPLQHYRQRPLFRQRRKAVGA